MLARGEDNELTLHGQYVFTEWFVSLHKYNLSKKQHKKICDYIESHAEEFLAKYPSDEIYDAAHKMIEDALFALKYY
jgi:hypothetical protein